MNNDVTGDEIFKAACHGLVMGCLFPVLAYNLKRQRVVNSMVYVALIGFEIFQVLGHVKDARNAQS